MAKRQSGFPSGPPGPRTSRVSSANRLLAALPVGDYQRLLPSIGTVPMKFRQVFQRQGDHIKAVYFPGGGVASITTVMQDGRMVELATVGNEGMVGITALLGGDVAMNEAFVLVPDGAAEMLPVEIFRGEMARRGPLWSVMTRYAQAFVAHIMQSSACNALHSVEQRCCRWLLMTHDRVGRDEFGLTQESLAVMLGVRRATVTGVARDLQEAGLITYAHGKMTIANRRGLESAACECYRVVKNQFARLLP